jgi:hypothetical protein
LVLYHRRRPSEREKKGVASRVGDYLSSGSELSAADFLSFSAQILYYYDVQLNNKQNGRTERKKKGSG